MELTKIELINLEGNFDVFQFILYYNNSIVHIITYTCEDVSCIFGNVVESTTGCISNDEIFNLLDISNAKQFVSEIVGYPSFTGIWPEVKTKKDFIKILHALECYLEF